MTEQPNREVTVLNAALELRPAERAGYLDQACAGDATLRQQVEALLQAHEQAEDFLDAPPAGLDFNRTVKVNIPLTEKTGDKIGRYKLLQQIGEGGCGVVYMAEQEEPMRRRVALKVIKLGMDTKSVIARFEAERQALALMDHPNIAKVLDAGATETGRPYFVMELVRGIKITDFCDENKVSTEDRLKLFIQVCQAIQHAHQKGIIHRDIKPSNIIVTVNDGVPVPKVIDFGIAKATQGRLTDKTLFTAFEQFIGTPAYMSPEQAVMTSLDIDTRSDIYSLGVLLYELLTGKTPFDANQLLEAGLDEMRRTIREVEPVKPSTRLTQEIGGDDVRRLTSKSETRNLKSEEEIRVSSRRLLQAKELIHALRGDLDWIVMKCLEKDRTRRYETANGLSSDITRYLTNAPIVARPPSKLYEFQKTVRRHRFGFAAAAAVMMALVIGLVASMAMFFRAQVERKKAQTEAVKSQQVAQFLKDMLNGVEPSIARGRDAAMLREILDTTAGRLGDLKSQPGVEADLRAILGNVYSDLGDYTNAASMLEKALELRKTHLGDKDLDVAASLHDLARNLAREGKFTEAEKLHREALAIRRKLLGNTHPDVAASLDEIASALSEQGDRKWAEIELLDRQVLAMRRKLFGDCHPDVAASLDHLSFFLWHQRKTELLPEAEVLQRESLSIRRKLFVGDHPDVAWSLDHLGLVLRSEGKFDEAEAVTRAGLDMRRRLHGAQHPQVATSLHNLASVVSGAGRVTEAEAMYREELAIRRKLLGSNHARVADSLYSLGALLSSQDRNGEAEPLLREALEIRRKNLGDNDAELAGNRAFLANVLSAQAKFAEAEDLLRAASLVQQRALGEAHPDTVATLSRLIDVLQKEGKEAEAKALLENRTDTTTDKKNELN